MLNKSAQKESFEKVEYQNSLFDLLFKKPRNENTEYHGLV